MICFEEVVYLKVQKSITKTLHPDATLTAKHGHPGALHDGNRQVHEHKSPLTGTLACYKTRRIMAASLIASGQSQLGQAVSSWEVILRLIFRSSPMLVFHSTAFLGRNAMA